MTASAVVGVLALQGNVEQHLRVLAALGARGVPVRRAAELRGCDALVLPGGESTTMMRLLRRWDLEGPVRDRVLDGTPVLGTCAGMILLADRLLDGTDDQTTIGGIDMTVRRNAFGRQVESFETEVRVAGWSEPTRATFIRAPWVEDHAPSVEPLAAVPSGPAAGRVVAVRQGPLVAVAFHPEANGDPRFHRLLLP